MTTNSARPCSELLLAYQGAVVHDLRGDLNGLLLTVDFLRRQLSTRAEVATLFGETLGDMDHVRASLNRTLNQLDMVGHARRAITRPDNVDVSYQNLSELAIDVVRNHIADRAKRRRIVVHPPAASSVAVHADPVLVHLALQRMLYGMTDLGRDTELTITVEHSPQNEGVVRAWFADPTQLNDGVYARIGQTASDDPKTGAIPALTLAMCLAEVMGGRLRRDEAHDGGGLYMELPLGSENTPVSIESGRNA